MWKNKKFSLTKNIFREINFLVTSLRKTLPSRKKCEREFFVFPHCVPKTVAMNATAPKITIGKGFHTLPRPSIRRAIIPPILATVEQTPTAVDLIGVGKSSDVYKYTMANPKLAQSLPNMTNAICNPATL